MTVEHPVYLPSGDEHLFGVLTCPTGPANGLTVLALTGGGWIPSYHRNQMWLRLARDLAGKGYHVFRMDYQGVGDSSGNIQFFELSRPRVDNVEAAVKWLDSQGLNDVVLVGTCYGGRTALAASGSIDRLHGVALLAVPVEDYLGSDRSLAWHLRRAFSLKVLKKVQHRFRKYARIGLNRLGRTVRAARTPSAGGRETASPLYVEPMRQLVARQVPVLIMFGKEDTHYDAFRRAQEGALGDALRAAGDRAQVILAEGELHGLLTVASQDVQLEAVEHWLETVVRLPVVAGEAGG